MELFPPLRLGLTASAATNSTMKRLSIFSGCCGRTILPRSPHSQIVSVGDRQRQPSPLRSQVPPTQSLQPSSLGVGVQVVKFCRFLLATVTHVIEETEDRFFTAAKLILGQDVTNRRDSLLEQSVELVGAEPE